MVQKEEINKNNCKVYTNYRPKDYLIIFIALVVLSVASPYLFTKITKSQNINLISNMVFTGVFILIYFKIFLKKYKECAVFEDPLNFKLFNFPFFNFAVSCWPVSHFIYYFALSYFYPDQRKTIFIFGITWEIIESILKVISTKNSLEGKSKKTKVIDNNGEMSIEYTTYWDSSFKDILFNSFGILCGKILHEYIKNKI
jgi:hypothetical protein